MIGITPITVFAGLYIFVVFGFTIMANVLNTIVLQTPKHAGGYGFSAKQNALCMFLTSISDVPYVLRSFEELICFHSPVYSLVWRSCTPASRVDPGR